MLPFYHIRGKLLVVVGSAVFIMMELITITAAMATLFFKTNPKEIDIIIEFLRARVLVTTVMILVVLCATLVSVYKLTRGQGHDTGEIGVNNRKAAWTVVILSSLFFVFNCIFVGVVILCAQHFILKAFDGIEYAILLAFSGTFIAIPFNSSINPIVYLIRRSDMRQFLKQRFRRGFLLFARYD